MRDHIRRAFAATPEAVRGARTFLQTAIAGRVDHASQSDLTLALSELASNAVRHAQTPFAVVVETNGHVRIEVEDGSTHPPVPTAPTREGGRGLAIIDQLCDRWGIRIGRDTKCVWCERDLHEGEQPAAAAAETPPEP